MMLKKHIKSEEGSVLMEFLLVCPVYIGMLGALFVFGMLHMTSMFTSFSEHYFAFAAKANTAQNKAAVDEFGKLFNSFGNENEIDWTQVAIESIEDDQQQPLGNSFLALYSSGIFINIKKVPSYMKIFALSLLGSAKLDGDYEKITRQIEAMKYDFRKADSTVGLEDLLYRSYVFRKRIQQPERTDDLYRGSFGGEIASNWMFTFVEPWPCVDTSAINSEMFNDTDSVPDNYKRVLFNYAE